MFGNLRTSDADLAVRTHYPYPRSSSVGLLCNSHPPLNCIRRRLNPHSLSHSRFLARSPIPASRSLLNSITPPPTPFEDPFIPRTAIDFKVPERAPHVSGRDILVMNVLTSNRSYVVLRWATGLLVLFLSQTVQALSLHFRYVYVLQTGELGLTPRATEGGTKAELRSRLTSLSCKRSRTMFCGGRPSRECGCGADSFM